jgi:enoyl-CoA hydratase/carnithine racemase
MTTEQIIGTTDGRVRTVTFNRPEKKNAFTQEMYGGMADELDAAAADPSIRVVVFTGSGDTFSGGNDVGDFLKVTESDGELPAFRFLRLLPQFPKPVLAAVNGPAVGIGTTMLLHFDMVYASSDAAFVLPFARLGLCPEAGSTLLLPRLAGLQRATELLLLGERFDAERAQEVGLVNEVVPPDRLTARVAERAATLAALPPGAVRASKALIREAHRGRLQEAMVREGELFRELLASPEAAEALTAFLEKRPPDFERFS